MKRFMPSGVIVLAEVLGLASATAQSASDVTKVRKRFDLREALLRKFFSDIHRPADSIQAFLSAKPTLMAFTGVGFPSLSIVEQVQVLRQRKQLVRLGDESLGSTASVTHPSDGGIQHCHGLPLRQGFGRQIVVLTTTASITGSW